MLLMGAGLVAWRLSRESDEPEHATPAPGPQTSRPALRAFAPPPPPPPPVDEPGDASGAEEPGTVAGRLKRRAEPCKSPCEGKETGPLLSALAAKGGQVRSCYTRALGNDPTLQGRMTVNIRVGVDGRVCSASVSKNALGSPTVADCVLERFRAGSFPPPQGGCVDAIVPLNFVSDSK
jgi:hypothetical protein